MWYLKCLLIEGSQLNICMLVTYVTLSVMCKNLGLIGHRLELPFHLVDQNREVFTRKSSFLVIFFLAGDLLWIVCCWSAFNRAEDVVFGYVHFINTECCILSIRTHGSHLCKIHWNGCDLVIFSTWVCLHADCEKSSRSTGVVLLIV